MFRISSFFVVVSGLVTANKTLESVYGPMKPIYNMEPWHQRTNTRPALSSAFFEMRKAHNCSFPIEVILIQDATNSFADDLPVMDHQIELMVEALKITHPESTFAVVSFQDKPKWSLGNSGDYCQHFDAPLSEDVDSLRSAYAHLKTSGGGDMPENQLGAILAAAQSETTGWANGHELSSRLMAVITDSMPHFEGDGFNAYNMSAFTGTFDEPNAELQCLKEYYPTPEQVQDALTARRAYLAQLVFGSEESNSLVRRAWEWFNQFLGQVPEFLEPLAEDSSNFWSVLSIVIAEMEELECGLSTTTTSPTTTKGASVHTDLSSTPKSISTSEKLISTSESSLAETIPNECESEQTVGSECVEEPDCCEGCACACGGVFIHVADKPKKLHLTIEN